MKEDIFLKQTSSVDRVSGEGDRVADFKDYLETTFANQKKESWELEKTEEEETMLSFVLKYMPDFLKKYGGQMPPLTLDHFHAVDADAENPPKLNGDAGFQSKYQRIIYSPDVLAQEPRLSRAQVMAHEISHASSYQYFREEETSGGRTRISFKRAGLQMAGRGEDDLLEEISGRIDEAVMDELAIRFAKELSLKEPWFLEDIPSADQLADQGGDQISKSNNSLHELKQDESGRFYFQPNSHVKEIRALNNIIQYVLKNKPEVYKTEEEVFDLFAKAALSNNLMPLLRALRSGMGERWLSTVKVAFLR